MPQTDRPLSSPTHPAIACIGGAVINRKYRSKRAILPRTSNPASLTVSYGGVARNVAENLARLGYSVSLVSALGDDVAGEVIRDHMQDLGVRMDHVTVSPDLPTAEYAAILSDDGELFSAAAAMDILDSLTPEGLESVWPSLADQAWVFAECNLPTDTLHLLLQSCRNLSVRLAVDTVSMPKAGRLPNDLTGIDVLFTNLDESGALLGRSSAAPGELVQGLLARGAANVVLTMGSEGHLVGTQGSVSHQPAISAEPVDVTGAGDALISATLHGLVRGESLERAAEIGALLAGLTVQSELDVRPELSADWLHEQANRHAQKKPES